MGPKSKEPFDKSRSVGRVHLVKQLVQYQHTAIGVPGKMAHSCHRTTWHDGIFSRLTKFPGVPS